MLTALRKNELLDSLAYGSVHGGSVNTTFSWLLISVSFPRSSYALYIVLFDFTFLLGYDDKAILSLSALRFLRLLFQSENPFTVQSFAPSRFHELSSLLRHLLTSYDLAICYQIGCNGLLSFNSHITLVRPPPVRCNNFHSMSLLDLHYVHLFSYRALVSLATLPTRTAFISSFCSLAQSFALRLPSDSSSRRTPLPSANTSH